MLHALEIVQHYVSILWCIDEKDLVEGSVSFIFCKLGWKKRLLLTLGCMKQLGLMGSNSLSEEHLYVKGTVFVAWWE